MCVHMHSRHVGGQERVGQDSSVFGLCLNGDIQN